MTNEQFRQLVREMREAQKRFFADRTVPNVQAAKTLENKVDRALETDEGDAQQETLL
jgi:hypothetical protein